MRERAIEELKKLRELVVKNSKELEKVIDDFKKKMSAMNGEKKGHEMLKLLSRQRSLNLAKRDTWILWVLGFLRVRRDGLLGIGGF